VGHLEAKVALVTGGTSGIGLATARRFIDEGAHVFITGRRKEELDAAQRQLGDQATAVQGDISDTGDLDRLYAVIGERGGRLDVLFANAGGGSGMPTIDQVTPESFDSTFSINVRGTVFTVQKALPLMGEGSAIVITGSTSASRGTPGFGIYSASKAALRQFARVWAAELAGRGIRVNVVVPGSTDTPGLRGIPVGPEGLSVFAARNLLPRVADPSEVASAVLFLASDQSSFVTGSELFVDGGEVQAYK
jgi:NAD(P)-dependent dehydrogenase (short-subunit alcohol dehydrogenase family)